MVKRFIIYHPIGGECNTDCKEGIKYHAVANVEDSIELEDVFYNAQNDHSLGYLSLGIRSTSVGDIITVAVPLDDELSIITCYMILDVGYKVVHPESFL